MMQPVGDRSQRAQVEDRIAALHRLVHRVRVRQVARDHLDLLEQRRRNVAQQPRVAARVIVQERAHRRALLDQRFGQVRPNKTGRAGKENFFHKKENTIPQVKKNDLKENPAPLPLTTIPSRPAPPHLPCSLITVH